ncbi:hypothetical protein FB451DRAFT_1190066 [Mycena latifolia]|nr:hypothetical protein FB451DRAFT_1190066 [Mycena latifolia]
MRDFGVIIGEVFVREGGGVGAGHQCVTSTGFPRCFASPYRRSEVTVLPQDKACRPEFAINAGSNLTIVLLAAAGAQDSKSPNHTPASMCINRSKTAGRLILQAPRAVHRAISHANASYHSPGTLNTSTLCSSVQLLNQNKVYASMALGGDVFSGYQPFAALVMPPPPILVTLDFAGELLRECLATSVFLTSYSLGVMHMYLLPSNAPPTCYIIFSRLLPVLLRRATVKQLYGDLLNTLKSREGPTHHTDESIEALRAALTPRFSVSWLTWILAILRLHGGALPRYPRTNCPRFAPGTRLRFLEPRRASGCTEIHACARRGVDQERGFRLGVRTRLGALGWRGPRARAGSDSALEYVAFKAAGAAASILEKAHPRSYGEGSCVRDVLRTRAVHPAVVLTRLRGVCDSWVATGVSHSLTQFPLLVCGLVPGSTHGVQLRTDFRALCSVFRHVVRVLESALTLASLQRIASQRIALVLASSVVLRSQSFPVLD